MFSRRRVNHGALAVCGVLAFVTGRAAASSISGPYSVMVGTTSETYYVIHGDSGTTYDLLQKASWTNDQAEAQALGTNLITLTSASANTAVVSDVAQNFNGIGGGGPDLSTVPLWIGLNDKAHDPTQGGTDDSGTHAADFGWADGSTATYRNWNAGEPSDTSPGEYYTAVNWHYARGDGPATFGTWNDAPNAGTSGFGGNTGNADGYYGITAAVPEPVASLILLPAVLASLAKRRR